MTGSNDLLSLTSRRRFLRGAGILGAMAAAVPAWAQDWVTLGLPGGPDRRRLTTQFPQKGRMILQRTRPPLLETPFEVFDGGVFTPTTGSSCAGTWRHPRRRWTSPPSAWRSAATSSGRSRCRWPRCWRCRAWSWPPSTNAPAIRAGFLPPRVSGGQWANGAMGNARWTGVRLRDVLDRAGVKAGAVAVRCNGLDSRW